MKLRKRILSLACAFALVVGMVVTAPGAFAAEGQWVEKAPMPRDIFAFSTATLNEKIYVMGGSNFSKNFFDNNLDIYDSNLDTWSVGAPMPTRRCNASTAVVCEKIYVMGGTSSPTSGALSSVDIYDTTTNQWEKGPSLPSVRSGQDSVAIGSKIYIIGGATNTLDILDVETNTWSTGSPLPISRKIGTRCALVGGKIYAFGGYDSSNLSRVDIYDPTTNSWSKGADMLLASQQHCAVVANTNVYIVGGYANSSPLNDVQIYDTISNSWSLGPSMNQMHNYGGAAYISGILYVLGGHKSTESTHNMTTSVEALDLFRKNPNSKLSVLLNPTETVQLSVTSTLSANADYTWTSTDAAVATVDANGKVTALAPGTCDIFAENSDGTFKESIPIRVVAGGADLFRLAVHLTPGQSKKLYMTEDPTETTWTSLDPAVAKVDANGKITAVAPGLVLMQATVGTETQQIYVRVK